MEWQVYKRHFDTHIQGTKTVYDAVMVFCGTVYAPTVDAAMQSAKGLTQFPFLWNREYMLARISETVPLRHEFFKRIDTSEPLKILPRSDFFQREGNCYEGDRGRGRQTPSGKRRHG